MMPQRLAGAARLAGLLLLAGSAAAQQPSRTVAFDNRHLAMVAQLYISAATDPDWGRNWVDGVPLPPGNTVAGPVPGSCVADIRIVFATGGAEERRAVDVCATPRVVLRPGWTVAAALDGEGPVAPLGEPGATPRERRLRNAGPLPVVAIYTGRPGGPRGEDRLGADTLPIGGTIDLGPEDTNACLADLVVVFRDGREVTRPGVDLCSGEEIELR